MLRPTKGPRRTSEWDAVLSEFSAGNGSKLEGGIKVDALYDESSIAADLVRRSRGSEADHGSGGFWGFFGNAASNVKDIATGLPGAIKLGVDQVGGAVSGAYGYSVGLIPGTGGEAARNYSHKLLGGAGSVYVAGAKDTASRWGKLAKGDLGQLYENPVFMALDAAAVVSGGQTGAIKAASIANKAGKAKVARVARNKKVVARTKGVELANRTRRNPYTGQTEAVPVRPAWLRGAAEAVDDSGALLKELEAGGRQAARTEKLANARSVAARTRSPIVVRREDFPLDEFTDAQIAVASTVGVPRRLAARTPIGRGLQAPFVGLGNKLRDPGERLRKAPGVEALSERLQGRQYTRAITKAAEELGIDRTTDVLAEAGARRAVNSIRAATRNGFKADPQAEAALNLHVQGLFTPRKLPDGSELGPLELRDIAVGAAKAKLAEFKGRRDLNPKAWEENQANIALLESIPDELITLTGNSRRVKKLRQAIDDSVEAGRKLDENVDPHGLTRASNGWRDVKGERRTLTQRTLLGGARFVEDAGPTGRVVVPRVHEAGKKALGLTQTTVGAVQNTIARAVRAGSGRGNGQLAKEWLNKHFPERVAAIKTDAQAVSVLRAVSDGRVKTAKGKPAPPGIREDARRAVVNAELRQKRETQASTSKTELYRVRHPDGKAGEWVVGAAGTAPRTVVAKARSVGGKVERVEVPTRVASKRQDSTGRITALPEQWERRGSEGARPVTGRDVPNDGGAGNPRLEGLVAPKGGPRPLGLRDGLQPGGWLPEAKRRVLETIQPRKRVDGVTGKVTYSDTVENAVARELLRTGAIKLTDLSGVPRGQAAVRAIERHLDKRMQGHIPLTKDGQIDWEGLAPKIKSDPVLRRFFNDPRLLSELPVDDGAIYVRHYASDALGRKGKRDRQDRVGRGPAGTDLSTKQSEGSLAGRLGFSLKSSSIPATWDQIARSVGNQNFLANVLEDFVAKTPDGKQRAFTSLEANRLDETRFATIPVHAFDRAEAALRDWTPKVGDRLGLDDFVVKPGKVPEGDLVYVVPREVGDHIRWLFQNPAKWLQIYDSALHAWRGGVLAMAPRWFINNYIGNTLFYGMFTGFDLESLRLARGAARDKLPYQIEGNTYSSQGHHGATEGIINAADIGARRGGFTDAYFRVTEGGFRLNQTFESFIRRAAYIHAAKRLFKENGGAFAHRKGEPRMSRKERDAELLEAVANAPDFLRRESLREMRQWMGDYTGLSRFERDVVRRAIPFYSWIRVLNTWLFGMPFRSPIRAEVLSLAAQLGREVQGDRSYLPWWEQGRIDLTDSLSLRTSGMNPLMTAVEPLTVFGQEGSGFQEKVVQILRSQGGGLSPVISIPLGAISGRNPFGTRDYTNPLGYGGTVTPFGQQPQYYNTVTGQVDSVPTSPNVVDELMGLAPFMPLARDLLSWKDRPYDSTGVLELAGHRMFGWGAKEDLFQPEPKGGGSGREKIPGISPVLGMLGAPIYRRDERQERTADWVRRARYDYKNTRSSRRQKYKQGLQWREKERAGG